MLFYDAGSLTFRNLLLSLCDIINNTYLYVQRHSPADVTFCIFTNGKQRAYLGTFLRMTQVVNSTNIFCFKILSPITITSSFEQQQKNDYA